MLRKAAAGDDKRTAKIISCDTHGPIRRTRGHRLGGGLSLLARGSIRHRRCPPDRWRREHRLLNMPIEPTLSSPRQGTGFFAGSNFRWFICGLLFLATTINYMDRQIIGILKVSLSAHYHWTENDYGDIVAAFQLAYALGYLVAGRMIDWIGVRWGFPIVVGLWSFAAGAHGLLQFVPTEGSSAIGFHVLGWTFTLTASVMSFGLLRIALGFFEGGHFPASIKVVSEWFPTKERAFATGIFNTGTNIKRDDCLTAGEKRCRNRINLVTFRGWQFQRSTAVGI